MSGSPRVLVVGAGLGGLVLARVLHLGGVETTVLERDQRPGDEGARSQGGNLDLHPDSGQRALEMAGLTPAYRALARPEGEELRIVDPSGALLVRHRPSPPPDPTSGAAWGRPEIERGALRDLLVGSLPEGVVRWGVRAATAEVGADGVVVRLEGGELVRGDLLVGADGARSVVRPLVTDACPRPLETTYVDLEIPDVDRTHPELAHLVGPGSLWVVGGGRTLSVQRVVGSGVAHLRVSLVLGPSAAPSWEPGVAPAAGQLLAAVSDWSPAVTVFLGTAADGAVVTPRTLASMPVGLRWESRAAVTLIGDAAHLMPPVGEGANQAMLDGAVLAQAVVRHRGEVDAVAAAVAEYEREMLARTVPVAESSAQMQSLLVSPDAAERLTRFFGASEGREGAALADERPRQDSNLQPAD